jgi:hypothetical protein
MEIRCRAAQARCTVRRRPVARRAGWLSLAACLGWLAVVPALAQQPAQLPADKPQAPPAQAAEPEAPLPGDWAPELLDGILSSPNSEAPYWLLRAAFAAGPAVVPQLAEALKDDRTAEFAAQSLAFIGGDQALRVLWKLLSDPRDLNLRRFTYGALAEYDAPEATNILFNVIDQSDKEPDRTVTETAVIALTVRTDSSLQARLALSEKKLEDVVIRDDLENARAVIEARAKYLATPEGKKSSGSIDAAVRTYFIPALEPLPGAGPATPSPAGKDVGQNGVRPAPGKIPTAPAAPPPQVTVEVRDITFSPDNSRARARVVFRDPSATAYYDFVLQKRSGNWTLASVWLGPEVASPQIGATPAKSAN